MLGVMVPPRLPSLAAGVGHKPEAISSVGRVDGTSRDNDRPAGVADAFHVRSRSVEPMLANRIRNLLSHGDNGTAGGDKTEVLWPEVAGVLFAFTLARN